MPQRPGRGGAQGGHAPVAHQSLRLDQVRDGAHPRNLRPRLWAALGGPAGATATRGEDHALETHLIPNVLAAARGTAPSVVIYGRDHPTPDGTAIRDFVHVSDLADAHLLALDHLRAGRGSEQINLGNGKGASVLEVLEVARRVTGRQIPSRFMSARAGDPPCLVADASRAQTVLGWRPTRPDLATIVESAWSWHLAHPDGYPTAKV